MALAVLPFLVVAPSEGAAFKATIRTGGGELAVHAKPALDSTVQRRLRNGGKAYLMCYKRGDELTSPKGAATTVWYRLRAGGYVSDAFLYTGSGDPVTPRCKTAPKRTWGASRSTNPGSRGYCTWGAYEKFKVRTGTYPAVRGNAKEVAASARSVGWKVVPRARPKSIVVFQPGVHGASSTHGHVAWVRRVEQRSGGRYIHVTEMNWKYFNGWNTRTVKDVAGMRYVLAPRG